MVSVGPVALQAAHIDKTEAGYTNSTCMNQEVKMYHEKLAPADRDICEFLFLNIEKLLPKAETKVWHAHPVCFIEGNPIVGYSKLKDSVRLLF